MASLRKRMKPEKLAFAQRMRRDPTPAEAALWAEMRRRPGGFKFRRQALMLGFIVDFYCAARRLVVEVDGSVHESEARRASDAARTNALTSRLGVRVIRFSNEQVLEDPHAVAELCARA